MSTKIQNRLGEKKRSLKRKQEENQVGQNRRWQKQGTTGVGERQLGKTTEITGNENQKLEPAVQKA